MRSVEGRGDDNGANAASERESVRAQRAREVRGTVDLARDACHGVGSRVGGDPR